MQGFGYPGCQFLVKLNFTLTTALYLQFYGQIQLTTLNFFLNVVSQLHFQRPQFFRQTDINFQKTMINTAQLNIQTTPGLFFFPMGIGGHTSYHKCILIK